MLNARLITAMYSIPMSNPSHRFSSPLATICCSSVILQSQRVTLWQRRVKSIIRKESVFSPGRQYCTFSASPIHNSPSHWPAKGHILGLHVLNDMIDQWVCFCDSSHPICLLLSILEEKIQGPSAQNAIMHFEKEARRAVARNPGVSLDDLCSREYVLHH